MEIVHNNYNFRSLPEILKAEKGEEEERKNCLSLFFNFMSAFVEFFFVFFSFNNQFKHFSRALFRKWWFSHFTWLLVLEFFLQTIHFFLVDLKF